MSRRLQGRVPTAALRRASGAAATDWSVERGDVMGALVVLGQFFIGVGVLLLGLAAIWFVSVYAQKRE